MSERSERMNLAAEIGLLETCKATIVLLYSRKSMYLAIKIGTIFFLLRSSTLQRRAGQNQHRLSSIRPALQAWRATFWISFYFSCSFSVYRTSSQHLLVRRAPKTLRLVGRSAPIRHFQPRCLGSSPFERVR